MPYLPELARLEWIVHRLIFAADGGPVDWQAFLALPPADQGRARLIAAPSVALFRSLYPVDTIWRTHNGLDDAAAHGGASVQCCVHRHASFDVAVTRLSDDEAILLDDVLAGRSLDQLGDGLDGDRQAWTLQRMYRWIDAGIVVGFAAG